MPRAMRAWKDATGERAIDMPKVAAWAVAKGWPVPVPQSPLAILAKPFADAGRELVGHDPDTGHPDRVYHAVPVRVGEQRTFHDDDIHEAPRKGMHTSLINHREQMDSDGVHVTLDERYGRTCHPGEEPIPLPMDLAPDIAWRVANPTEEDEAAEGRVRINRDGSAHRWPMSALPPEAANERVSRYVRLGPAADIAFACHSGERRRCVRERCGVLSSRADASLCVCVAIGPRATT